MPKLADFARAVPDLTIVLNHLGGLTRVGLYADRDDEVLAAWRRGIAAIGQCSNVCLKLGGIGMPRMGFDWHARARPIGSEELAAAIAPLMRASGGASSGKSISLGMAVSGYQLGDRVADLTVLGSNAAYCTLRADRLTRVPAGVDAVEAPAIAMSWITWQEFSR